MKKIAMAVVLVSSLAAAGQANAHGGWGGGGWGGGGYYGGAAVVGAVTGLLVGSAVASQARPAVVYPAQPVYVAPPPAYCYDAYGRGYPCAPPPQAYYGPPPGY